MTRSRFMGLLLLCLLLLFPGCAAFIEAGFRELDDHGHQHRYEHKSYWAHFADCLFVDEDGDDDCR